MQARTLAVMALGADRPGIIAAVAEVLVRHGGTITDSQMTVLGGHFALMLLVEVDAAPAGLEGELTDATSAHGLVVTVRLAGEAAAVRHPQPTHVVSVYGPDRPGLVHAATAVLADHGVNVTDLATRVLVGEGQVYAMHLEVQVPDEVDPAAIEQALRGAEALVDVDAHVRPLDVATL